MPPSEPIHDAVEDGIQRITRAIESQLRSIVDGVTQAAIADRTSAVEAARESAQAETAQTLTLELEKAREDERRSAAAVMDQVLDGVCQIEAGASLTEVLEALMEALTGLAQCAALTIVQGDRVRAWRLAGFAPPFDALDLPASETGLVGRAISTGASCLADTIDLDTPPYEGQWFGPVPASHRGVAVPLIVGGKVAAVAYADGAIDGSSTPRFEPAAVEVLVRYAARCLEALTAVRTA